MTLEIHHFDVDTAGIELPVRFNNPFYYKPHRLCCMAADEVKKYIAGNKEWSLEVANGKMMGVLVVREKSGSIGYLMAFSGLLCGSNRQPGFVPAIFDFQSSDGYFKCEEAYISQLNRKIADIERSDGYSDALLRLNETTSMMESELALMRMKMRKSKKERDVLRSRGTLSADDDALLVRESQFQKAEFKRLSLFWQQKVTICKEALLRYDERITLLKQERKVRSAALQEWLFGNFILCNGIGDKKSVLDIFAEQRGTLPPAGTGECAAPKLLQYAYMNKLQPLCMAEFWMGASPIGEVRRDGCFYGSCKGKCEPLLSYMLQGIDVDAPAHDNDKSYDVAIVYEDDWLIVTDKPEGMLSVPGKTGDVSLQEWLACHFGRDDIYVAHRLDMSTSGLIVAAKGIDAYKALQKLFVSRKVKKKYMALLDGVPISSKGEISLPLMPDYHNRPAQKVDYHEGKEALTKYKIVDIVDYSAHKCAIVELYPHTGRTHQLRVHCAHNKGLDTPIVGDALYGKIDRRLMLHAASLEFVHPFTGKLLEFESPINFID